MSKHLRDVISLIIVFLSVVLIVNILTGRTREEPHQAGIRIQPAGVTTGEPPSTGGGYPVSVMEHADAGD